MSIKDAIIKRRTLSDFIKRCFQTQYFSTDYHDLWKFHPISRRFLYDDFMGQASTKETLSGGSFMSVINVLMQLRKVCNHPDLFEGKSSLHSCN